MKKAEQLRSVVVQFRDAEAKRLASLEDQRKALARKQAEDFKDACYKEAGTKYAALMVELDRIAANGRSAIRYDLGSCASNRQFDNEVRANLRLDYMKEEIIRLAILDGFKVTDCSNTYNLRRVVTIDISWAPFPNAGAS